MPLLVRHDQHAVTESLVAALPSGHSLARQREGFSPKILQVAPQLTSVINPVATGVGVSIVPAFMAQIATAGVVCSPLTNAPKGSITLVPPCD